MDYLFILAQLRIEKALAATNIVVPEITPSSVTKTGSSLFDPKITTPGSTTSLQAIINNLTGSTGIVGQLISTLTLFAGVAAVGYLIWGGIQYITSQGNADRIKAARARIVNAIIGIVIITAAYAIIRIGVGIGQTVDSRI